MTAVLWPTLFMDWNASPFLSSIVWSLFHGTSDNADVDILRFRKSHQQSMHVVQEIQMVIFFLWSYFCAVAYYWLICCDYFINRHWFTFRKKLRLDFFYHCRNGNSREDGDKRRWDDGLKYNRPFDVSNRHEDNNRRGDDNICWDNAMFDSDESIIPPNWVQSSSVFPEPPINFFSFETASSPHMHGIIFSINGTWDDDNSFWWEE